MKKLKIVALIAIAGIIVISNIYPTYFVLRIDGIFPHYNFQSENGDFKFTAIPAKGRDIDMMNRKYDRYVNKHGIKKGELYRTFRVNPFKFWNWYHYATNEYYQYKFKRYIK